MGALKDDFQNGIIAGDKFANSSLFCTDDLPFSNQKNSIHTVHKNKSINTGTNSKKILLVNPPLPSESCYPPLGLLSIASIPFSSKVDIMIKDYNLVYHKNKKYQKVFNIAIKDLMTCEYDLIGITANCNTLPFVFALCEALQHQKLKIILGGPGVTFLDKELLDRLPNVLAICRNEGEQTFQAFVNNNFVCSNQIPNISYFDESGKFIRTNSFFIENLDTLSFPFTDIEIDFNDYPLNHLYTKEKFALIEAGRGCPYDCSFCTTNKMWGRRYRVKSPLRIKKEIMHYLNKGYRTVSFVHDNLACSKSFMEELCGLISDLGIAWSCSVSLNNFDKKLMISMKEAGCRGVFLGIESGSKRIKEKMPHKHVRDEKNRIESAIKCFDFVTLSFIAGFPDEDEESYMETIAIAHKYRLKGVNDVLIQQYCILPGSRDHTDQSFVDTVVTKGRLLKNDKFLYECIESFEKHIQENKIIFINFFDSTPLNLQAYNLSSITTMYNILINVFPNILLLLLKHEILELSSVSNEFVNYILRYCSSSITYDNVGKKIQNYLFKVLRIDNRRLIEVLKEIYQCEINIKKLLSSDKGKFIRQSEKIIIQNSFPYKHVTDTASTLVPCPGYYIYVLREKEIEVLRVNRSAYLVYNFLKKDRERKQILYFMKKNNIPEFYLDKFISNKIAIEN
ncbi:MAG: radical SAM protein [Pseudomonadota bacterium]